MTTTRCSSLYSRQRTSDQQRYRKMILEAIRTLAPEGRSTVGAVERHIRSTHRVLPSAHHNFFHYHLRKLHFAWEIEISRSGHLFIAEVEDAGADATPDDEEPATHEALPKAPSPPETPKQGPVVELPQCATTGTMGAGPSSLPKRRGRPPKKLLDEYISNQSEISAMTREGSSSGAPKRRGRPPKKKKKKKTTTTAHRSARGEDRQLRVPRRPRSLPSKEKETEMPVPAATAAGATDGGPSSGRGGDSGEELCSIACCRLDLLRRA